MATSTTLRLATSIATHNIVAVLITPRCKNCRGPLGPGNKSGYCTLTQGCLAAGKRHWRKTHSESVKRTMRGDYERNHAKRIVYQARARARSRGREFTITVNDLPPIPEFCPALGQRLRVNKGKAGPNSPALDRIDSAKGYVPGNVQWLSQKANNMKSDATPEELRQFALWILEGK